MLYQYLHLYGCLTTAPAAYCSQLFLTEAECFAALKQNTLDEISSPYTESEKELIEKIQEGTARLEDIDQECSTSTGGDERITIGTVHQLPSPQVVVELVKRTAARLGPHERLEFLAQLGEI